MKRILVAEDDRSLVKLLESILKEAGYETKIVLDGADCLQQVKEFKPDLILLDVMLPRIDGYQICRTISEDSQYSPCPKIIILTVRKSELDKTLSNFAGADMFVSKPFNTDDLLNKIKFLLE